MKPSVVTFSVILILALLLAGPFFAHAQQPGKVNSYHLLMAERGAEMIQADRPGR